jgi:Flp pilus assembly protein TadB
MPEDSLQQSAEVAASHGIFTDIAYFTSWIVAIVGSVVGGVIILTNLENADVLYTTILGVMVIIGSWLGAAGLGVLAEISRKLSH